MVVSVALATYNGERFLLEQLTSIQNQSVLPTEIVLCDDQSTDDTIAIAKKFAETAPFPIRIYRNDRRLHYGENFLKAANLCQGVYISFCDQDDIWLPRKIELSLKALRVSSAKLCVHNKILIDEKGDRIDVPNTSEVDRIIPSSELDPWTVYPGYSYLFHRNLLDKIPSAERPIDLIAPDRQSAHDSWVYFLVSIFGSVIYLAEPLVLYRQHARNVYGHREFGLGELVRKIRDKYVDYLRIRAEISRVNAALIREYKPTASELETVQRALRRWSDLEHEYQSRYAAFASSSLLTRLARLVANAQARVYRDMPAKTRYRSFVEDLVGAVIAKA